MIITKNTKLNGVTNEPINVSPNCVLELHGISTGTIKLEPQAKCVLYGIHNGNILVDNAICSINGILNGSIANYGQVDIHGIVKECTFSGNPVLIHQNAIVNNKRYDSDSLT